MKRQAIKWIIAASAIIFLIGGTAWADGKGDRGRHKSGKSNGYHSAPQHSGGHGPTGYQKRPPLGKYRGERAHHGRHHKHYRPNYGHGHHRPYHGNGHYRPHRRPQHGHGFHSPHHHGSPRAKAVRVKNTDIHRGVAMSLLTANPLFALDAIINHR